MAEGCDIKVLEKESKGEEGKEGRRSGVGKK